MGFLQPWRSAVEVKEEVIEEVSAVVLDVGTEAAVEIGAGVTVEVGVVVPSVKRRRNGCLSRSLEGW